MTRGSIRSCRFGLGLLALAYVTGLSVYFALLALGVAQYGWLGFLRELTLYLFVPEPALLLAALIVRARGALALLLLPISLFAYFYGPQLLPRGRVESESPRIRVLTFNAGGNEGGGQTDPLIRLLRAERADLVALQETPQATLAALATSLHAEYPHQIGTPDAATLSRFPILNASDFSLYEHGYLNQQMDVDIAGTLITLTNVHIRRPTTGLGLRGALSWGSSYEADWRDSQIEVLVSRIDSVVGAQVVTGDFNQTEWSPSYPRLVGELQDSFREAGWGFGHTFPSNLAWARWDISLPLLRIDYVFHSRELLAREAHIGPASDSHHLPVIVDLSFR